MSQKKINLLHLITGLGVGGAERVVLDLVKNTNKNTYNTSVISMSKRTEMMDEFQKNHIDIVALKKNNSFKEFISIIIFLKKYIKEKKIDIIHAHMTHAMIAAVIVKVLNPKTKIVFTSHNIAFGSKFREKIIWFTKLFRDKDILFSKEQLGPIYKKDYMIIPNGVDTNTYKLEQPKYDKFTFLSVGRLEKVKNHIKLLQCAKELKETDLDFQIFIAGEGDQRKELEKFIQNHKLDTCVTLLGLRSDIADIMARSHVLVMPSLWEGLPIVMLEAGASKLPVISTPVGTIPSLLNKSNGYLIKEDMFCKIMEYVYKHYDEALIKAKKLQGKIIENYSIESVARKHEEAVYMELVNK